MTQPGWGRYSRRSRVDRSNEVSRTVYTLVQTAGDLDAALEQICGARVLGVDTETTGLDPFTSRIRLLQISTADANFVIDLFSVEAGREPRLRDVLSSAETIKIFHNAKFDLKMLLHHFDLEVYGVFDTFLTSKLVGVGPQDGLEGAPFGHGLAAVSDRHLGEVVDKTMRLSDWSGPLTPLQHEYAAKDSAVMIPLYGALETKLRELGLSDVARLEFECVLPLAAMELSGMAIDAECWRRLVSDVERAHEVLSMELKQELAAGVAQMTLFGEPDINLDSPAQVTETLARMGIHVEGTRSWQLQPLAKDHPAVAKLLEYRGIQKAMTSYGVSLLDHINPMTGRLHPDFHQIGATGGRMSCSEPNLQQVPNTPEYRMCFRAPAGRKLVIADYSQIEIRILADWSQDTALSKALISGEDLHRVTASQMFGVPLELVSKDQRAAAKQLNYGLLYGLGPQGLANRIDCSPQEAEELIRKYFGAYSGVAEWLRDAANRAVLDHESRTRSGRLIIYSFDPRDRAQVAAAQRLGKNAPIQGSCADILKRALARLYQALKGMDASIVNCVHDEIVVEVADADAEECAVVVEREMTAAAREFIRSIPVTVDVTVSDAWMK
jgi:DNA polymerase I-like protein with 3'-5' exonuclease and polymerase domains